MCAYAYFLTKYQFTLRCHAGPEEGDIKLAAGKQCSTSVRVSGKSGKCNQQYIGASKSVTVEVPNNNNHDYCKGVKLLATDELRKSIPIDQTGCVIDSSAPCSGC